MEPERHAPRMGVAGRASALSGSSRGTGQTFPPPRSPRTDRGSRGGRGERRIGRFGRWTQGSPSDGPFFLSCPPFPPPVGVVTVEILTEAIRHTLVAHGKLPPDRAEPVARLVLSYFGTEEMVLDNVVSAEDRDTFYAMEEEGLLSSEEEDALVAKGKTWRIHYWLLKKATIEAASRPAPPPRPEDAAAVYREVPPDEWARHEKDARSAPPPAP